jgi:hypothetical protein
MPRQRIAYLLRTYLGKLYSSHRLNKELRACFGYLIFWAVRFLVLAKKQFKEWDNGHGTSDTSQTSGIQTVKDNISLRFLMKKLS